MTQKTNKTQTQRWIQKYVFLCLGVIAISLVCGVSNLVYASSVAYQFKNKQNDIRDLQHEVAVMETSYHAMSKGLAVEYRQKDKFVSFKDESSGVKYVKTTSASYAFAKP